MIIIWRIKCKLNRRFDGQFRKQQLLYEKARKQAKNDSTCQFDELPIFPMGAVPYDSDSEHVCYGYQHNEGCNSDDFMTQCLQQFRANMPELLYMCGDKHRAAGTKTKVLLAIEEVEQTGNELAVAALIVTKRGMVLDVSIRWSCWPNTIYRNVPRRRGASDCWHGFSRYSCYRKYFAPIRWKRGEEIAGYTIGQAGSGGTYHLLPEFNEETELTAQSIVNSMNNLVQRVLRTI